MIKRIFLSILGILVIFAAIAGVKALQIKTLIDGAANFKLPPEVITTATADSQIWESSKSAIATFKAVQGVTVMAEVPGKIVTIAFEAGARIEKGDLLVQQDVATEQAQLKAAEASVALAKTTLDRSRRLLAQRTVPQSDFDSADATYKRALANVEEIKTQIGKKTIRAPFSGRLGIREVNLGEVLSAGQTIVTLQSLDPIYAEFSLPQQDAPKRPGQRVRIETDMFPDDPAQGTISVINPVAQANTRSILMQATIANPAERYLPGMFGKAVIIDDQQLNVLAVPSTSVMYAPYGDSVYVVEQAPDGGEGLIARQQLVILGERRGDFVAINKGLKQGEVIATTGVFKLRNGQAVVVDNSLAPEQKLDPQPADN